MRYFALLALFALPGFAIETVETIQWQWRGSLSQGKALAIRGITGDIRALPSVSGEIEVSAKSENSNVEIRAIENQNGVTVCAVKPGAKSCGEDSPGFSPARINYEVRIPSGVRLLARTVNGAIEAHRLASDVDAATVNGEVLVSTSGTAQVHTINGSIEAWLLRPFWEKAPEFTAVNGRISVRVPENAGYKLRVETRNGKVVSALTGFRGKATEQSMEGQIGAAGGGSPMIIRTLNGAIELRQKR